MQGIFGEAEAPRVSPTLYLLDLGGSGVRGMAHVPALDGYLVIGGPAGQGNVLDGEGLQHGRCGLNHNPTPRRPLLDKSQWLISYC